ncbi:MAG: hypothetical protein UU48_C0004G0050 [Candidatus Uhrbacteria bacterium GW2011_GWF2_41_16]|uniref:Uncharacterized protein n=1 Tax=Candidatus Uhrbacteria bacterium GW2011_GWF2_41_16 TaxID=1618997 RepID=A0A0G0YD51_9BACT|nr:MAG: hypothetical protein UU48_C0004G0050 [Candidatus Uhrbacteria bacterium GW2011_GWF2_41_16]
MSFQEYPVSSIEHQVDHHADSISKLKQIQDLLRQEGISTQTIEIPHGTIFKHAILFPYQYTGSEPLVRAYRGINQLDTSLLQQVSYALRSREENADSIQILEHARQEVALLTSQPTYKNLLKYIEAVWPDLTDKEIRRLQEDLESIEDDVLSGFSLRLCLVHKTFGFTGGHYTDTGIPPYISVSTDPIEATNYGEKGLMILDLPLSKYEALTGKAKGEISVKGDIPKEWIVAVLPRTTLLNLKKEEQEKDINQTLRVIETKIPHKVLEEKDVEEQFKMIRKQEEKDDLKHHEEDIRDIQTQRIKRLLRTYTDLTPTSEEIMRLQKQESIDAYTATKRALYDILATQYEKVTGRSRKELEEFMIFDTVCDPSTYITQDLYYERKVVTETMLKKLAQLVTYQEMRQKDM